MEVDPTTESSESAAGDTSRLEQARGSADAYGIVLFLLILVFALPGIMPDGALQRGLVASVACASAVLSLYVSRIRGWAIATAAVVSVLTVAVAFSGGRFEEGNAAGVIGATSLGILLVASPLAIGNRIARHTIVTARTVLGALCIYLQIALAFSFFFRAIETASAGSYSGLDASALQFMYFSIVTMTTLGYGDIAPVSEVARSASMLETLLGQVFLVVVVARVVSQVGSGRTTSPAKMEATIRPHEGARRRRFHHRIRRLFDEGATDGSDDTEEHTDP